MELHYRLREVPSTTKYGLFSRLPYFGLTLAFIDNPSPGLGTQIIQAISPPLLSHGFEDAQILNVCSAMHAILVSELRFFGKEEGEGRELHLQRIITTYLVFVPSSMGKQSACKFMI